MLLSERISDHRPGARGLPQLGEMPVGFRMQPAGENQDTPYRLPKLTASEEDHEDVGGIYSRYGYTHSNPYENLGEKGESSFKWKYPLPTKSFRIYPGPTFREAVVAPSSTPRLVLPGARVPQVNRLLGRSQTTMSGAFNNTRPTPVTRSGAVSTSADHQQYLHYQHQHLQRPQPQHRVFDAAGSRVAAGIAPTAANATDEDGELQWMLNPQRHFQVDKKGQQRNQGPYSREFTVHAMAPPNWLRMKLGRRQMQQQSRQQLLLDGYRSVTVPAGSFHRQLTSYTDASSQY